MFLVIIAFLSLGQLLARMFISALIASPDDLQLPQQKHYRAILGACLVGVLRSYLVDLHLSLRLKTVSRADLCLGKMGVSNDVRFRCLPCLPLEALSSL